MATMAMDNNIIRVALTGNPNTGKSTIFNEITGARQKIGNWPGVTVDKKEGHVTFEGKHIQVIDLPGTYSVNARSPEEKIVIDYLQEAQLDLVVDVIDSSNLERNLFLTVQLLEKGIPLMLDLNMQDEAKRRGIKIDVKKLEKKLGRRVTLQCHVNPALIGGIRVEVDGQSYNFCVEKYLRDESTDVYKAVEGLKVGDVVDIEGFLYWYNGANLQATSVTVK